MYSKMSDIPIIISSLQIGTVVFSGVYGLCFLSYSHVQITRLAASQPFLRVRDCTGGLPIYLRVVPVCRWNFNELHDIMYDIIMWFVMSDMRGLQMATQLQISSPCLVCGRETKKP